MKKFLAMLLVVAMSFSLVACGNQSQLTEQQQIVVNAVKEYQETEHYKNNDTDPNSISISKVVDYKMDDYSGYNVNFLLVEVADVNKDTTNNLIIIDTETKKVYCEDDLDIDNWGDFSSIEDVYASCLMGYLNYLNGGIIWSEMETTTELSEEDIIAINNNLK